MTSEILYTMARVSKAREDRIDYREVLISHNITEAEARAEVAALPFRTMDPERARVINIVVAKSDIEGMGVFSLVSRPYGVTVGLASNEDGSRNELGRYVNHSCRPNCQMWSKDDIFVLETIEPVFAGEELTIDYRLPLLERAKRLERANKEAADAETMRLINEW